MTLSDSIPATYHDYRANYIGPEETVILNPAEGEKRGSVSRMFCLAFSLV